METADRGEAEGYQALIVQPLPRSQGVLAHGRVCKPFAYECWLIGDERWPTGSWIRRDRWPTSAHVGKPEVYCSQAATGNDRPEEIEVARGGHANTLLGMRSIDTTSATRSATGM